MDCKLAESLLGDYLDDQLSDELKDQVGRHLIRCQRCAWEVESLRETLSALKASVLPMEASPEFRERLLMHLLNDHRAAVAGRLSLFGPSRWQRAPFVLELASEEGQDATEEHN